MKFEINKLSDNCGYELKAIGEFEPNLILITDRFYSDLTADNDPLQYKNWRLPYKYTELSKYKLPIQIKCLYGEFHKSRDVYVMDRFNLQENGKHIMLIYDWIRDRENVTPEDILKLLPYNIYNVNKYNLDRGYGTLYVIMER